MDGLRWEQADRVVSQALEAADGASLRDAPRVAVMSDALLRISEAVALDVADIEAEASNTVSIKRSETDQEGEGQALYIRPQTVRRGRSWRNHRQRRAWRGACASTAHAWRRSPWPAGASLVDMQQAGRCGAAAQVRQVALTQAFQQGRQRIA